MGKQNKGRSTLRRGLLIAIAVVTLGCCVTLAFLPPLEDVETPTEMPGTATAVALVAANETSTQAAMPTATETLTPTPTITLTPTVTLPPSDTPTPLPPEIAIPNTLNLQDDEVIRVLVNEQVVTVRWYLTDLAVRFARTEAETLPVEFTCKLREMGYTAQTHQLTGVIRTVDNLGNSGETEGVEVIIPPAMHEAINCDNQINVNLETAVGRFEGARYDLSPLLR